MFGSCCISPRCLTRSFHDIYLSQCSLIDHCIDSELSRSLDCSVARSSLDPSLARSLIRSIARSLPRSIARPLNRSIARSLDLSIYLLRSHVYTASFKLTQTTLFMIISRLVMRAIPPARDREHACNG